MSGPGHFRRAFCGCARRRKVLLPALAAIATFAAGALANPFGHFGAQRWSGDWSFVQQRSGLTGDFGLRHESDGRGLMLLRAIGGKACHQPSDYFAGGYTIPPTSELAPGGKYLDTGKIRGCTVGNPDHLVGRYQSDASSSNSGNIELWLATGRPSGDRPYADHWTGTFTVNGKKARLAWNGQFEGSFSGDGAFDPSSPPYRTLAVTLYGKFFNPPNATVAAGATITMCNHDPFQHRPFSLSRYNKFSGRALFPGQCRTVQAENPTPSKLEFRIYDEIHSQELLTLVVLPR
jgi:hypothetical protein